MRICVCVCVLAGAQVSFCFFFVCRSGYLCCSSLRQLLLVVATFIYPPNTHINYVRTHTYIQLTLYMHICLSSCYSFLSCIVFYSCSPCARASYGPCYDRAVSVCSVFVVTQPFCPCCLALWLVVASTLLLKPTPHAACSL